MFTKNKTTRKRGRPPGRTLEGEATRRRLYAEAIALIAERGYQGATLRDVAQRAGVSPALLYRYFPDKGAVVLALYDELSAELSRRAATLPDGVWQARFVAAVELSLEVLAPHRVPMRALVPQLVGDSADGVFAERTRFSRVRVEGVFQSVVAGASDAPATRYQRPLGQVLYVLHLGVVLWWLLDQSPDQRATAGLLRLLRKVMPLLAMAWRLPFAKGLVGTGATLIDDALTGEARNFSGSVPR